MKRFVAGSFIIIMLIVLLSAALLVAGCVSGQKATTSPASAADDLFAKAGLEFNNANYRTATRLSTLAQENYTAAGNAASALKARDKASIARRMTIEFPLNRTQAEQAIAAAFPDVPAERRAGWLSDNQSIKIRSDGEELFFFDTVGNIWFHNPDLMQKRTAGMNRTPLYDQVKSFALSPKAGGAGPYVNPVTWEGSQQLSIPRGELPKSGTLILWVPVPIESGSQTNVTIFSVEPSRYVRSLTGTKADIGLVYLEIPLDQVSGDFLNVTTRFWFTQAEQRFVIDPAKVGSYNISDPLYRKYTAPGTSLVITPEIRTKAQEIVGNETNPYRKAQKIYWHIMDTLPYSHVPHVRLDTAGIPEPTYVLSTGFGDCGSQSMYFAALCRAVGVPTRAIGGYQLVPGNEGTHFWAEYYLEGYGWIPVDVTIAEGADWSYDATPDERHRFKEYYFSSLDPYRYIIQNDVDIPIVPDPGDTVMYRMVVQTPKIVCDTCTIDPELILENHWTTTVKKV